MRLFPPAKVAPAPAYSYLPYIINAKCLGHNMPGVKAHRGWAAWVRFEPRPLPLEQITSNCGSRTIDNAKLKEVLETNLNRKFFNWPASSWDFSMLTLAALHYHPELDGARARHISINT